MALLKTLGMRSQSKLIWYLKNILSEVSKCISFLCLYLLSLMSAPGICCMYVHVGEKNLNILPTAESTTTTTLLQGNHNQTGIFFLWPCSLCVQASPGHHHQEGRPAPHGPDDEPGPRVHHVQLAAALLPLTVSKGEAVRHYCISILWRVPPDRQVPNPETPLTASTLPPRTQSSLHRVANSAEACSNPECQDPRKAINVLKLKWLNLRNTRWRIVYDVPEDDWYLQKHRIRSRKNGGHFVGILPCVLP